MYVSFFVILDTLYALLPSNAYHTSRGRGKCSRSEKVQNFNLGLNHVLPICEAQVWPNIDLYDVI